MKARNDIQPDHDTKMCSNKAVEVIRGLFHALRLDMMTVNLSQYVQTEVHTFRVWTFGFTLSVVFESDPLSGRKMYC